MKKYLISICLMLFTIATFAQALKPVKLDDQVTISIPGEFTKKDTLGQQIYSGTGAFGYMMAIRQANAKTGKPLVKEKDLKNVMQKYMKGIQDQSGGGSVNFSRDTTIHGLEARRFTLEAQGETGLERREFVLMYTQDATYTFEYVYAEARKELVKPEIKQFFSSINVAGDVQRTDQFTTAGQPQGMSSGARIGLIGGGAMIIALILYFVFRKKERIAGI